MAAGDAAGTRWFTVRCLVEWPAADTDSKRTYEERVTLWRSSSFEDAVWRAEGEAREYAAAADPPLRALDFAQVYELFDEPADGAEVFSLLRDSDLAERDYVNRHFESGAERQNALDGERHLPSRGCRAGR